MGGEQVLQPAIGRQAIGVEEYDRVTMGERRRLIPRPGRIAARGSAPQLEHSCAGLPGHCDGIISGTIVHNDDFESSSAGTRSLHRANDSGDGKRFVPRRDDDGKHSGSGE
jgi:hypothetical protein